MKNLMKRFKENNKGFTLVELIVVIAVLAVITVVAAPQYLQYVEKSREGVDENALGEIAHIAEISYVEVKADNIAGNDTQDKVEVTIANGKITGIALATGTAVTGNYNDLNELILQVMPANQYEFKSTKYKAGKATITIASTGVATPDVTTGLPFTWN